MKDTRFVVMHAPGPRWRAGAPPFEQDGIAEHVSHYRTLLEAGKLEMGGPFTDAGGGGMMIVSPDVSRDEIEAFAAADPAVRSGLLRFDVRPWIVGMKRTG